MAENILPPARGTILKLAVTADLGESIHMEDVQFECKFFCSGLSVKSQTVKKEEMIQIGADEYLACVDTSIVGVGEYCMRFTAWLPDTDVNGGLRQESVVTPTGIRVTN